MAMLQEEQPSPNKDDSLNRSNKDVSIMEASTIKQPSSEATQEEATEDVSHIRISDSNNNPAPETRPTEPTTNSAVEDTVVATTVVDPPAPSIRTSPNNTTEQPQQRSMKLIVRSQYWGRTLKGKTCRSIASLNRAYRTISAQAVLYNTDEYWGCCPHHGKRVLEMQECHFQDVMPDQNWDLYSTANWVSPNYCVNDFFLLPQNQTIIDVSRNIILSGWNFIGTCTANNIRDDLDEMLRPWLAENDNFGFRYHHVHIEIMMDKAFDRETPRSRKVNNEQARLDRQHYKQSKNTVASTQESSEATDDSGSSVRDGPPSAAGNPFVLRLPGGHAGSTPPIPHVISNDSSSVFSRSVASSAMPYHDGYAAVPDTSSFWGPSAPPGVHPPNSNPHPGMQWHPGRSHPLASPVRRHHQQPPGSWPSPSDLPPPPPSMQGQQLDSPQFNHHPGMTDLQQYLMYAETYGPPPTPGHPVLPQYHHYQQQHHLHQEYYSSSTPSHLHHHHQQHQYPTTYSGVPLGAHVPSEILSSPTPTYSGYAPQPMSPAIPVALHAPQLTHVSAHDTIGGAAAGEATAPPQSSTSIPSLEAGIATLSVSNKDSMDSVVTTVASNNMVSSTCWSKVAAATSPTTTKTGASPPSTKNGRLRLPTAD